MIGGLIGLQRLISEADVTLVDNIHGLVRHAQDRYGSLEVLPFQEIVKSITSYQTKRRGRGRSGR